MKKVKVNNVDKNNFLRIFIPVTKFILHSNLLKIKPKIIENNFQIGIGIGYVAGIMNRDGKYNE